MAGQRAEEKKQALVRAWDAGEAAKRPVGAAAVASGGGGQRRRGRRRRWEQRAAGEKRRSVNRRRPSGGAFTVVRTSQTQFADSKRKTPGNGKIDL